MEYRQLLVEPDDDLRGLLLILFRQYPNLDTVACDSFAQAVDVVERANVKGSPFSMIFTESRLPDGSGFDLAEDHGARVPVFIFAANAARIYQAHGQDLTNLGVRALIQKPFSPAEVRGLIEQIIVH